MSKRLIYLPLECYESRYTLQWAAPKTGWLERRWQEYGINYLRIDSNDHDKREIKVGSVVDGIGRVYHCFSQIRQLLAMAEMGNITKEDVIYFDDFWHPGIEALPYAFHLLGIKPKPKFYAFCHAQSIDEYDFTAPMEKWIRPFEKAIFNMLDGMFVCCPMLKDFAENGFTNQGGGLTTPTRKEQYKKIHVTGHPFASDEVLKRMPVWYQNAIAHPELDAMKPRKNQVVWSSRWDTEKNPRYFMDVIRMVTKVSPDTTFVVCTSAKELRSNDPTLLREIRQMASTFKNVEIREGLTKEEYYAILCDSKVQFNCALQDWVAITLLEATVAGCFPIYPHFRSFPETFLNSTTYTYPYDDWQPNPEHAVNKIVNTLKRDDLWDDDEINHRHWIHARFFNAAAQQLDIMGFEIPDLGLDLDYKPYDESYVRDRFPDSVI